MIKSDSLPQPTSDEFASAKGPFHDLRLAVVLLTSRIHIENKRWWMDMHSGTPLQRNTGELLMLVVSELAEAMEGHRKNLPDDKLPHRPMIEVELADALIRICDMAAGMKLDLAGAVAEKLEYNSTREDHTIAHRLTTNGKKY
jgi:NTP pyrophosphatase (non-canonical NTP hydrolase)